MAQRKVPRNSKANTTAASAPLVSQAFSTQAALHAESVRARYETTLKQLVDIPSVSVDPAHKGNIDRTAEAAVALLQQAGASARIINTAGNPVVYGEMITDPSHPTVLIYNHLDVQPADPLDWKTDPFGMTIENGIYRGRGTTDDKGPALAVLFAAEYARSAYLPLNIKFVWELEEEIGSPSFHQFLLDNAATLRTDSVVISDTIWVSRERPAIPYGLRGLQGFLLRLQTGAKDVHSGTTGGLSRNPIGELAKLINDCYNAETGRIKIPGFYRSVRRASKREIESFVQSGFSIEAFQAAHELSSLRTTDPREAARRIWALPTLEVHGITGGYNGPGIKTIVPHKAEAKISMRLVPDMDPDEVAERFTRFVKCKNADVEVVRLDALRPYLGDFTGPYAAAATEAMRAAFGKDPAYTREGGSIGAVLSMSNVLSVPIVFLGLSLPEHGYHAVNENFDWQQAGGGIRMFSSYFSLVSQMKAGS